MLSGAEVMIPEIIDYEIRRELLRADKLPGIQRLDAFAGLLGYLPIKTAVFRLAAQLWASARKQGRPTADEASLDIDVILCAQALELGRERYDPVIATTNVRHLSRFTRAAHWKELIV